MIKTRRIAWHFTLKSTTPEVELPAIKTAGEKLMQFGDGTIVGSIDHEGTYAQAVAFVDNRFAAGDVEFVAIFDIEDRARYVRGTWKGVVR